MAPPIAARSTNSPPAGVMLSGAKHLRSETSAERNICGAKHLRSETSAERNICGAKHLRSETSAERNICGVKHLVQHGSDPALNVMDGRQSPQGGDHGPDLHDRV